MPYEKERISAAEEMELFHEMCVEFKKRKELDRNMQVAADGMHSLYQSLIVAGFTQEDAMLLVRDTLRSVIVHSL